MKWSKAIWFWDDFEVAMVVMISKRLITMKSKLQVIGIYH